MNELLEVLKGVAVYMVTLQNFQNMCVSASRAAVPGPHHGCQWSESRAKQGQCHQ